MKSFEKEYRKMIQKEAPDFWNKIEAELADRESTLSVMTGDREKIKPKKWLAGGNVWRYAGIAAACFCVVILFHQWQTTLEKRSGMSGTWVEETASKETTDTGNDWEEAVKAEGAMQAEGDMPEEGAMPAEGDMPAEGTMLEEGLEETVNAAGLEDGAIIGGLDVKIMEATQMKYHSLYRAVVLEDRSGVFQTGDEIMVMAERNGAEEMEEGGTYYISVAYDSQSEPAFHLVD